MGYTTYYTGEFILNKPLDEETKTFLIQLSKTRRMKRDSKKLEEMGYGKAEIFGIEGEFFVDGQGVMGQNNDESIVDYNHPPSTQPGLWCQWEPNEDGTAIEWDGRGKFYDADKWIDYIANQILAPKGYKLNGEVLAEGQDEKDKWYLIVKNNKVKTETVNQHYMNPFIKKLKKATSESADDTVMAFLDTLGYSPIAEEWAKAKYRRRS